MKVRMNRTGINKVNKNVQMALIETAEAVLTDMVQSQVIPFREGNLQKSHFVDDKRAIKGVVKLVADTPYSRKVFFDPEITIHTDKNPNARQRWVEAYTSGNKKDLPIKYFAKFLKRRME